MGARSTVEIDDSVAFMGGPSDRVGLANVETQWHVGEERHRITCFLGGIELPLSSTSQRSVVEARD